MKKKKSIKDSQEYESSPIHYDKYRRSLLRNFSAHFFRWSFARRLIQDTDDVLEIGCGIEYPLANILLNSSKCPLVNTYHGVDINPLPTLDNVRITLQGDFNFVDRWKELRTVELLKFSMIVHLEVIEHMLKRNAIKLLTACRKLLCEDGRMIMSTPVFNEHRFSKRHVHEYTIPDMKELLDLTGFKVVSRFGTFMDIRHIKTSDDDVILSMYNRLSEYFDNPALSCFFAPLFPDKARDCLWVCEKL